MYGKDIIVDKNLQESIQYRKGEFPVIRRRNSLDSFREGEMACHWHPEFQFGLLLKGELEYSFFKDPVSRIRQVIKAGDGFFVNSRVLHSCRQLIAGTEIFTFGMPPGFFISPSFGRLYQKMILPVLQSRVSGFVFSHEKREEAVLLNLFRKFQALCPQDIDYELHSMELICRIWEKLFCTFTRRKEVSFVQSQNSLQAARIREMAEFIWNNYQNPITVNQIAKAGGVSRRECFRCFRMVINQTPTEYLNQYRLSMAAHLLTSGNQPLAAVSEACGFENISYFTKLFKKRYGMLPSQFRE